MKELKQSGKQGIAVKKFTYRSLPYKGHQSNQPGQALVEFALVLPILLVLVIGIMDFGRALFVYSEVSNAAREAVRYATVNPGDCEAIINRAKSMFSLPPSGPINVTVRLEKPSSDTGSFIEHEWCGEHDDEDEAETGDRIKINVSTTVSLWTLQMIAPLVGGTAPSNLPITYQAARSVVPPEGIATGPTTTPPPTRPGQPGATNTPTHTPTPTPPAPPANFTASSTCSGAYKVQANWSAVLGLPGYRIYRLPGPVEIWEGMATSDDDIDRVAAGTSTSYYVVAYNAGGEGPRSNTAVVTCGDVATNTPEPSPTPTFTRTPTNTPTNTPTPTQTPTATATPTDTPTPTPTQTATPGPSPTPTDTPTPTATTCPLTIAFAPGYPAQKTSGTRVTKMYVKVQVTQCNIPVTNATVTFLLPPTYLGTVLSPIANEPGFYGESGSCWERSTSAATTISVQASLQGGVPVLVSASTDSNPAVTRCP